jgi:hypothetical protein
MKKLILYAFVSALTQVGLSGCATQPSIAGQYISVATDAAPLLQENQAKVVIVRDADLYDAQVYSLRINGQFHSVILRQSWTNFNLCGGIANVVLVPDAGIFRSVNAIPSIDIKLVPGKTLYFSAENGRLSAIGAEQALALQDKLRPSQHALSRVIPTPCG